MISVGGGDNYSLNTVRLFFEDGHTTEAYYEKALRAHRHSAEEMKSIEREFVLEYHSALVQGRAPQDN